MPVGASEEDAKDVTAAGELMLTAGHALGFLLFSSSFLIALFFLLQAGVDLVLIVIIFAFVAIGSFSLASVVVAPALVVLLPADHRAAQMPQWLPLLGGSGVVELAAVALSWGVSISWFCFRHTSWAWALQDGLDFNLHQGGALRPSSGGLHPL